jgi:hypothetical protein
MRGDKHFLTIKTNATCMNWGDRKLEIYYRLIAVYNRLTRSVNDSDLYYGQPDECVAIYLELTSSSSPTVNEGCGISRYSVENNVASIGHL